MPKENKFTILKVLDTSINTFGLFCKKWKILTMYALIFALLTALSGSWSHTCKDSLSISWWCADAGNLYFAYAKMVINFLAALFLSLAFCYDIHGEKSEFSAIFRITKNKLKFIAFAFVLCAVFFASLGIAVWLTFRKANPDWLVEFGFFLIVFSLATLAVLILRTSASLGLFLQNGKMPNFKQLFKLTHGKFYVVLVTFCLITYAINLLQMRLMGLLELWNIQQTYFHVALISEFLSSVLKFAVLAVYIAYFSALAQCLVPAEFAVKAKPANDVESVAKVVRRKAPAKAAKSSKTKAKSGKKSK